MIALGAYDGLLARAVRQLKFDGRRDLARPLGQALGTAWLQLGDRGSAGTPTLLIQDRHAPMGPSRFGLLVPSRFLLQGPSRVGLRADPPGVSPLWIPVPSHPRRLRSRGYDHTALLARAAWRTAGAGRPLPGAIVRVVDTPPLYRLTRQERAGVLAGAFVCPRRVAGPVILVDDILTTGATAREAAGVLRAAGATRVDLLVVARV